MNKSERIEAIVNLGKALSPDNPELKAACKEAYEHNSWFTELNVNYCLANWNSCLAEDSVKKWLDSIKEKQAKEVGIIMAGNLPLVGMHDLLAVIGSGHAALVKKSHNDDILMQYVIDFFHAQNDEFKSTISVVDQMKTADAVIATGSNNSSRYFDYYFRNIPHVIRKNRTGVAVLDGTETANDLSSLADDIFRYFGLGCRNVTKLYVPDNYRFEPLFQAFERYEFLINHHKYANNYTYHKAIFLMNLDKHLDTGFVLVKEDKDLHSPLSCLFYELYSNQDRVWRDLEGLHNQIQIVVSREEKENSKPFGSSQQTSLFDYADDIDILQFLSNV